MLLSQQTAQRTRPTDANHIGPIRREKPNRNLGPWDRGIRECYPNHTCSRNSGASPATRSRWYCCIFRRYLRTISSVKDCAASRSPPSIVRQFLFGRYCGYRLSDCFRCWFCHVHSGNGGPDRYCLRRLAHRFRCGFCWLRSGNGELPGTRLLGRGDAYNPNSNDQSSHKCSQTKGGYPNPTGPAPILHFRGSMLSHFLLCTNICIAARLI